MTDQKTITSFADLVDFSEIEKMVKKVSKDIVEKEELNREIGIYRLLQIRSLGSELLPDNEKREAFGGMISLLSSYYDAPQGFREDEKLGIESRAIDFIRKEAGEESLNKFTEEGKKWQAELLDTFSKVESEGSTPSEQKG